MSLKVEIERARFRFFINELRKLEPDDNMSTAQKVSTATEKLLQAVLEDPKYTVLFNIPQLGGHWEVVQSFPTFVEAEELANEVVDCDDGRRVQVYDEVHECAVLTLRMDKLGTIAANYLKPNSLEVTDSSAVFAPYRRYKEIGRIEPAPISDPVKCPIAEEVKKIFMD